MAPTANALLTACLALWLVGCQSSAPRKAADQNSPPASETNGGLQRIDPRLLEQTDTPAMRSDEDQAKAYHSTTKYADSYPVFQRSRILVHGGYSVRFGTSPKSTQGVCYYFDAQGHLMRTAERFPPY